MDLIEMANRFGCISLKLFAESELVKADFLLVENICEILLFADSHCCALLREEEIKFCVINLSAVKASPGWCKLKEMSSLGLSLLELAVVLPPSARHSTTLRPAPAQADTRACWSGC
jgi:hypothetical protein